MDISTLRTALLWCTVINYVLLILWVLIATVGRTWFNALLTKIYRVTPEQAAQLHLTGIAFYKILIIVFNLVPLIALWIVGK